MVFEDFLFLAMSGLLSTAYKVLKSKEKLDARFIMSETILSLIFSIIVVPAIIEEQKISFTKALVYAAFLPFIGVEIIKVLKNKLIKKTEEL